MVNELSFWEKERLEETLDITIIGAGIVGLSTAISLVESDPTLKVGILERGIFPLGASTKNAGFGCFGSVSEILDDLSVMPRKDCIDLISMRWKGLNRLRGKIPDVIMHYESLGAQEVFRLRDGKVYQECLDQITMCNDLVEEATEIKGCYQIVDCSQEFNNVQSKVILNPWEGQLNPVKMMGELKRIAIQSGVSIFYGIEVEYINTENKLLTTSTGLAIPYNKLVLCTNAFTRALFPDIKVIPARNQVLITEEISNISINGCYHMDKGYLYFRNVGNRILLGGGRNLDRESEMTDQFGTTEMIQSHLNQMLNDILNLPSDIRVEHRWSGILGIHETKRPIIKWYNEDVLLGVRLGGMGVAIGSYLGEILSEMIINESGDNRKPG